MRVLPYDVFTPFGLPGDTTWSLVRAFRFSDNGDDQNPPRVWPESHWTAFMSPKNVLNISAAIMNHRRTGVFAAKGSIRCPPFTVIPLVHKEFETSTIYLFLWRPIDSHRTHTELFLVDEDHLIPAYGGAQLDISDERVVWLNSVVAQLASRENVEPPTVPYIHPQHKIDMVGLHP